MKELHLTFYNSENRKVKEVLKNVRQDLAPEEIRDVMEDMVRFDQPQKSGLRRLARVVSAKYVEKVETVLFVNDVKPEVTMEQAEANFMKKFEPKVKKESKPITQSTITVGQMTRFSPSKTAKIMYNDIKENRNEAIPRYLSNLMHIRLVNNLLTRGHQIDTQLFAPVLNQMYALPRWDETMVAHLPYLKEFFPTPEWSQVIARFSESGREAFARLAGDGTAPDYAKADQQIQQLQLTAQAELHQYELDKAAFTEKFKALSA